MRRFYTSYRILVFVFAAIFARADDEKPCTARDGDRFYDLNPLKSSTDYEFKSQSGQDFVINVCRAVVHETWAIKVDDPANVAGFTQRPRGHFSIGEVNSKLLVRDEHPLLMMTNGSPCVNASDMKASTAIRFICDTSVFGGGSPQLIAELPADDDSACAFVIEWRTHIACPTHERADSMGFAGIFAIILAVLFALYMICGVLYNRFVLELQGLDQIPRYSLFSFGDSVALFHRCIYWIRSKSPWHSDNGRAWANGRSEYSGLAASHDEQEAIMHGPPGFLDEQDEEEDEHPPNVP